jgi:hypothetical protein
MAVLVVVVGGSGGRVSSIGGRVSSSGGSVCISDGRVSSSGGMVGGAPPIGWEDALPSLYLPAMLLISVLLADSGQIPLSYLKIGHIYLIFYTVMAL